MSQQGAAVELDRARRRSHERRGRLSEFLAAGVLLLKGYRIPARRHRSPYGEIDLMAVRGRSLAFVKVKLRPTLVAAEMAKTRKQANRLYRAAGHWVWRHSAYHGHEIGFVATGGGPPGEMKRSRLAEALAERSVLRWC
jgi:putative endonuclease